MVLPAAPHRCGLRPASTTFCGIAATGSYVRFNSLRDAPLFYGIAATGSYRKLDSLRDAPPGGEAFYVPRHSIKIGTWLAQLASQWVPSGTMRKVRFTRLVISRWAVENRASALAAWLNISLAP